MNPPPDNASAYIENRVLLLLLIAVSVALGWVLLPVIVILRGDVHCRLAHPRREAGCRSALSRRLSRWRGQPGLAPPCP